MADYEDAIQNIDDSDASRQLRLVMDCLRLSASLLSRYPTMLPFELIGRLLPLVTENSWIKELLKGCDLEGPTFNCFIPAHHVRSLCLGRIVCIILLFVLHFGSPIDFPYLALPIAYLFALPFPCLPLPPLFLPLPSATLNFS